MNHVVLVEYCSWNWTTSWCLEFQENQFFLHVMVLELSLHVHWKWLAEIRSVDFMFLKDHVGRFHVMSQQPMCSKTMKMRPCWCSKRILRKRFFVNAFFFFQLICIDAGHVGENALNLSIFPKSVTQAFSERKLLFKSLIEKKGSMALHDVGWNVGVLCL